jgi:hypothetical protein
VLAWMRDTLQQVVKKYDQCHDILTKVFCKVLTSPNAYCNQLAEIHLQALSNPVFKVVTSLWLYLHPEEQLYFLLFTQHGQSDLEKPLSEQSKKLVWKNLISKLLKHLSWYSFSLACKIATNYQKHIYPQLDSELIEWYESFWRKCSQLVQKEYAPEAGRGLHGLLKLIHGGVASGTGCTASQGIHSSATPLLGETARALLPKITDLLLLCLERQLPPFDALKSHPESFQELTYLLDAIGANSTAAWQCGAYNADKALYFKHIQRLLPFSILYLRENKSWDNTMCHLSSLIHLLAADDFTSFSLSEQKARMQAVSSWLLELSELEDPLPFTAYWLLTTNARIKNCFYSFANDYAYMQQKLYHEMPDELKNKGLPLWGAFIP